MEQEKRQKEITRHGLIRVGLWLGGGWLLLVLCAWGILPDREVPGILWVGLGLLTAELAILWGKTWWESRGRGQAIPAGAHWWQAEKEELAAAAVMLAVWWGFLALCAAGVLPHMEPDRYSWLLAGAVTILFGAELLLYPTAIGSEPILECDSMPHWQRCMQGHAAANLMPVIAANRIGTEAVLPCPENGGQRSELCFYGSSFLTDETGALLQCAPRDAEAVLLQTYDLDALLESRSSWGLFRDRRPEYYGAITHRAQDSLTR